MTSQKHEKPLTEISQENAKESAGERKRATRAADRATGEAGKEQITSSEYELHVICSFALCQLRD